MTPVFDKILYCILCQIIVANLLFTSWRARRCPWKKMLKTFLKKDSNFLAQSVQFSVLFYPFLLRIYMHCIMYNNFNHYCAQRIIAKSENCSILLICSTSSSLGTQLCLKTKLSSSKSTPWFYWLRLSKF